MEDEKLNVLLAQIRKELHEYPELSGKEYNTQKRIYDFLNKHTKSKVSKIAGTGLIAVFEGDEKYKTIMLRADIDALPIQEVNSFLHKSKVEGVSHKCGHDGHTTIMLGVAKKIADKPVKRGTIILLFQPSEENGMGAKAVLQDDFFKKISIDYVFSLHNLPGFIKHEIVIKKQEFTSNVKSIIVKLKGRTAHAAEPEKGFNPAMAIGELINFSNENTYNNPESEKFFLITLVHILLGEKAYGISAGYGEVHLTIRSWSTDLMKKKSGELIKFINQLIKKYSLEIEIVWLEEFYANVNNDKAVDIIENAAKQNTLTINKVNTPFKWGEDFGLFTQKFKGAMFGLGAGIETPALHNPDYDFPDEITITGVNMFYSILTKI
ncbi:amidohydrolase [Tenacibaculum adriaticum]|uniref:Amidohydrolase n=1 Tax=Tenacibaculum adriaticum TaxID=413713 RepID=A0A5S5DTM4_9FLAO|nr:amidohydrolase [Tenacibaculum adriaticum]TYP99125.1 amidohydrolase [Tenacibaculum adriaticum]